MWSLLSSAWAVTVSPLPSLGGHPTGSNPHVRFDPTGTYLVSWAEDGVRIWAPEDGGEIRFVQGRASVASIEDGGKAVLIGYEGHTERVEVQTGTLMQRWTTGWDWLDEMLVDGRSRWLVVSDVPAPGEEKEQQVAGYSLATGDQMDLPEEVRKGQPRGFSPTGQLFYADGRGYLNSWDPNSGECWRDMRPGLVARVDWSAGGGWMAVVAWDAGPGAKQRVSARAPRVVPGEKQPQPWHRGWLRVRGPSGEEHELDQTGYALALSPRGRWVALARDTEIRLVDGVTGDVVGALEAGSVITSLDWGASDVLVAGTTSGLIKRWRVAP
jgi:hypothetical protein